MYIRNRRHLATQGPMMPECFNTPVFYIAFHSPSPLLLRQNEAHFEIYRAIQIQILPPTDHSVMSGLHYLLPTMPMLANVYYFP